MRRLGASLLAGLILVSCTPETPNDANVGPVETSPSPVTGAPRPNVLLVVTDDMRPDGLDAMPFTVDWLIRGGRTYTNAFATTPLCCPSRASIFTGRYAHNHGVFKNHDSHDLDTTQTIQSYLQEQTDYRTAIVGKYLNSWSVEEDPPGFDMWASYSGRYYGKPFNVNGKATPTTEYSTYHMADRSVQFLRRFERNDEDPWFLYVATVAPHAPFTVAPQHKAADVPLIRRDRGPVPSLAESDLSDKPNLPTRAFSLEKSRQLRKKQWRTLLSVDDMMRTLRRSLAALGEEKDTLVIFTSDQGLLQGEHGMFAKRLPYTESIEVPLLMRWPGNVTQSYDDRIVANIDLAPTIAEVAGVTPDTEMDGISLLGSAERDLLFIEQLENWRVGLADWRSIRGKRFQYVEYYGRGGDLIEREYYDLRRDPYQLRNLFGDENPANDPDHEDLTALIKAQKECRGEACLIQE